VDVSRVAFIAPAIPGLKSSPPAGEARSHELKLDGYRVRLHKAGRAVTIYSKNGADFTRRFLGKVRIQGLYRFAVML
jgi:bifunctional non-homologous end joining protein LigD